MYSWCCMGEAFFLEAASSIVRTGDVGVVRIRPAP
jgi:hypothetical protein